MKRLALISCFAVGCASNGPDAPMPAGTGRVQASLTATPASSAGNVNVMPGAGSNGPNKPLGVKEIIVTIDKVTAHSSSAGWVKLSDTEVTVDVLKLADYAMALGFANMPAGKITQIRLYVKDGGTQFVTRDDGTRIDLKVPSGIQSGIKLKGMFDVNACQLSSVPLQFDGKRSIWVHPTGQGDEWILRPVIRMGHVDATDVGCTNGPNPTEGGAGGGSGTNGGTGGGNDSITPPGGDGNPTAGGAGGGGSLTEGGAGPGTDGLDGSGSACATGSTCLSGSCLSGICSQGAADAPCRIAGDCASGVCTDGACAPGGALGTGSTCVTGSQCLSGTCLNGRCDSGGQGQPCTGSGDCLTGYSCQAGSCVPPGIN